MAHKGEKYVHIFVARGTNFRAGDIWTNRTNSSTSERLQSWCWCPSQRTKVIMENGKNIQSDCLKNIQRCPSTTFTKKFNKKTGLSRPKNLSLMVTVR